ncbi:Fructosamine kinase [Rubripirellula obstinata]|uniref:Fructosamine kinase n=1 Tax=Rubripirellula obstinata TaxID=406547 RepID=A0A5B1CPQ7_9BACT|nr:fructosamine kinase family protein [Rubripirellula obstinata]KAA1261353.1 Fructosamine kinase [Rubripirellula obstinata]
MRSILDVLRELLPQCFEPSGFEQSNANGRVEPVGGGSISDAWHVWLPDQRQLFVKSNSEDFLPNFQAEERGLAALYEAAQDNDDLKVARPLMVAAARSRSWLVMDWISSDRPASDFFGRFGRGLAKLHHATLKPSDDQNRIGWPADNFLGSAKQVNAKAENWPGFVAEHRIGYQIRWAVDQGLADRALVRDCELIMQRMDSLLDGRQDTTSLLHGDLWSGNYLASSDGAAVIIDPAVYYGCREAEFGMLKLFGGCPDEFYRAYDDEFPMADGWQKRVSVYVLYHLLNHLNLFGSGYLSQCKSTAADVLR